jgi:hypothetical protein
MNKELEIYYQSCEELVKRFFQDFYGEEWEDYYKDLYWIGGKVGEVFEVSDMYLNLDNVVDYYLYKFTPDELMDWYWGDRKLNMKTFKVHKKD